MKRIKAACISQTLVFSQKPELELTHEQALAANRAEVERYKANMERAKTRYQIIDEVECENGEIVVRVRKQYNDKADVSEYFC